MKSPRAPAVSQLPFFYFYIPAQVFISCSLERARHRATWQIQYSESHPGQIHLLYWYSPFPLSICSAHHNLMSPTSAALFLPAPRHCLPACDVKKGRESCYHSSTVWVGWLSAVTFQESNQSVIAECWKGQGVCQQNFWRVGTMFHVKRCGSDGWVHKCGIICVGKNHLKCPLNHMFNDIM